MIFAKADEIRDQLSKLISFLKIVMMAQFGGDVRNDCAILLDRFSITRRRTGPAVIIISKQGRSGRLPMSSDKIWLFDTTLRDGGQTRGVDFHAPTRLRLPMRWIISVLIISKLAGLAQIRLMMHFLLSRQN